MKDQVWKSIFLFSY